MFENLLNLVSEHAGDAIINNPAIPNEQNEDAIASAHSSIMDVLQDKIQNGGLENIMSMFQGQGNDSSSQNGGMIQDIVSKYAGTLGSKFGLDEQTAQNTAQSLIPQVMSAFQSKTADPNDNSFNAQDIISQFTGGSGIGSMLGNMFK